MRRTVEETIAWLAENPDRMREASRTSSESAAPRRASPRKRPRPYEAELRVEARDLLGKVHRVEHALRTDPHGGPGTPRGS